jgi:hypothetical protein
MKELRGSIWVHFLVAGHFVCITTNGTVKKDGRAVMGRGNAKQTTIVIPGITERMGSYLREIGNRAGYLEFDAYGNKLVVFPVKKQWWEDGHVPLIADSLGWLKGEAESKPSATFHLPRPGCGNGKLNWEKIVKPLVESFHLPDNVIVHHIEAVEFNTGE